MHLTPARLAQGIPVATLPSILQSLRAGSKYYDRRLTHVTSEKLCDDTLRLLEPSLPPPHTCDIIDINPGPCIWSRKLHDLLKPRRHVLVELPYRHEVFAQFTEPLLALDDSPYRYAKSLHQALDPKRQLLSEDVYRFRDTHKDVNEKFAVNKNLLVTANLSGAAKKIKGFTGSEAKRFLNHYYRSIYIQEDYLSKYGLVRLLAWIGEDARLSVMPLTVNSRTKQSVQMETVAQIDQIVGPTPSNDLRSIQKRWYDLDVENQRNVQKEQKQLGIKVAPRRRQPDPILPFTALEPTIDEVRKHKDTYPYNQVYIKRVLDLDHFLATKRPSWYETYQSEVNEHFKDAKKKGCVPQNDPKEKKYRRLMTQLRTHHNTYLKAKDIIWEQRRLFKDIQDGYLQGWFSTSTGLPLEGPNQTRAAQLIRESEMLEQQRQRVKVDTRALINKSGDDYRSYDSKYQSLAWNVRHHEPLLVKDSEFFPNHPLTLLDFQPKPEIPMKLDTVDKQICFDYVCTTLMMNAGDTILAGVTRLVSAGCDQFLERVPELRDPTKGGWWNLDHVRVRSMHPDLFVALGLAFHDWPHRPEISKLMAVYRGVFDHGPV